MSIAWINQTSEFVVALLRLFGFVTGVPFPLLQLTILAWGNSMGDMAADVSMTKKGFGEMAITATIAGPVFNTLIGMSLSNFMSYAKNAENEHGKVSSFGAAQLKLYYKTLLPVHKRIAPACDKYGGFDYNAMVPIIMIGSEMFVIALVVANAMINKYTL